VDDAQPILSSGNGEVLVDDTQCNPMNRGQRLIESLPERGFDRGETRNNPRRSQGADDRRRVRGVHSVVSVLVGLLP
jgi:hypothetical protein